MVMEGTRVTVQTQLLGHFQTPFKGHLETSWIGCQETGSFLLGGDFFFLHCGQGLRSKRSGKQEKKQRFVGYLI